jgi:hypothetical protein
VDDLLSVRRDEHVEQLVHEPQHLAGLDAAEALGAIRERLALEQLHDQEGRPVLGHVDVADRDDARVLEAVDRVRLLLEAGAQLGRAGDLGMEDLDGLAPPDLVHADVDRGHPADAEQPLERPFAAQRCADAALGENVLVHRVRGRYQPYHAEESSPTRERVARA